MMKFKIGAMVAAGVLVGGFATSASAADLGGNCCADLEERIAELEATTARKGNRKVSLTISGWVAQQVMWWDDSRQSNVYITDTGSISIGTHVKFSGQATIVPGWTAGYVLNLEAIGNDSLLVSQSNDNGILRTGGNAQNLLRGTTGPVDIESSYWFIKSDELGKVSVGAQSSAADNQAILPDGSGSLVVANYVLYDSNAFFIRQRGGRGSATAGVNGNSTALTWGSFANCSTLNAAGGAAADCDGVPDNNVRYDSPTFAGFSMSASWGEDDAWALSGRYAGEWNSIKVSLAVAYNETNDRNGPGGLAQPPNYEARAFQVGGYVEHVPTGLFVYGAYGHDWDDTPLVTNGGVATAVKRPDGDNFYVKAGIRQRWTPLGHTILYGEYGQNDDKMTEAMAVDGITSSNLRQYGFGVVQEVDAAAMSLWLSYRHYDASADCSTTVGLCGLANDPLGLARIGKNDFDSFELVKGGALINF